jgi:hypothetical protein
MKKPSGRTRRELDFDTPLLEQEPGINEWMMIGWMDGWRGWMNEWMNATYMLNVLDVLGFSY